MKVARNAKEEKRKKKKKRKKKEKEKRKKKKKERNMKPIDRESVRSKILFATRLESRVRLSVVDCVGMCCWWSDNKHFSCGMCSARSLPLTILFFSFSCLLSFLFFSLKIKSHYLSTT